jgi:hypothetical protein
MTIEYNGKKYDKIKDLLVETTINNLDKFLFNNEKLTLSDFIGLQEIENSADASGSASNSGYRGSASNSGDCGSASNSGYWGSASVNAFMGAVSNTTGLYGMVTEFIIDGFSAKNCDSYKYLSERIVRQNAKLIKFTAEMSGKFYTLFKNQVFEVVTVDGIRMLVLDTSQKLGYTVTTGITYSANRWEDYEICNKKVRLSDIPRIVVVERDGVFSHGKTIEQAIKDFRYKIGSRDTKDYEYLCKEKGAVDTDVFVKAYRAVTGACETGTKMFMERLAGLKDKYTVAEALTLLRAHNAYRVDMFEKFIKNE